MNLLSGMQALANFGTGYFQGQQTSIQNAALNQHNQLANQALQTQQDQVKLSQQQQQALSDKAMQLSIQSGEGQNKQAPPATPADPSQNLDNLIKTNTELAKTALAQGDVAHFSQLSTNAVNAQDALLKQQQTQAAIQVAELKRQQQHYSLVASMAGQILATQGETPAGFHTLKMAVLSDATASPLEKQNFANMQYAPGVLAKVQETGMTASQQAASKLEQQKFAEKQRIDQADQFRKNMQLQEKTAHDRAIEQARKVQTKAGAASRAPTETQLDNVTQVVKDNMPGVDVAGPEFDQARRSIAARAAQIVQGNRAVTFPQAASMAAEEAKKNGEFEKVTSPDTHAKIFGHDIPFTGQSPTTKASFKEKGAIPDDAIPFTGQAKSELVPGKFYKTANGTMQWTGTGWKPQS